jgi:hypothetical protein
VFDPSILRAELPIRHPRSVIPLSAAIMRPAPRERVRSMTDIGLDLPPNVITLSAHRFGSTTVMRAIFVGLICGLAFTTSAGAQGVSVRFPRRRHPRVRSGRAA